MHRHTQTHRPFSPLLLRGAPSTSRDLGQEFRSSRISSTTAGARQVPAGSPQGLSRTPRAAQHLPAEHQHLAERKTDLELTLLCCIFLLICKLPLISERLSIFDLLQHLLSRTPLLGDFFRAQLLLNCIVF